MTLWTTLRAVATLALTSSLSACFLWSAGSKGPAPSPLPVFQSSVGLRSVWQGQAGATAESLLQPTVVDDSVYAAGRDGSVVRYDSGREVWRTKAVPRLSGGVGTDGKLVVVGSSDGVLQALNADRGGERWHVSVAGEILGTPFVAGDVVVVRVGDNQVAAYDATDGKRRWIYQRAQAPLALRTHSSFARAGDLMLAGFPGGKLVALTLNGGFPRWEASIALPKGANELDRMADVVGEPIVRGDLVCVAAFQGRVACLDHATGVVRWTRDFSSSVGLDADDKGVYLTDANGSVMGLDARTGATVWKQDKLMYRGVGRPLIVGERVAVADAEGWVHLIERLDGRFAAQVRLDSSGVAAPLVRLGQAFVAQSRGGALTALAPR